MNIKSIPHTAIFIFKKKKRKQKKRLYKLRDTRRFIVVTQEANVHIKI